jgi:hypothetical protein
VPKFGYRFTAEVTLSAAEENVIVVEEQIVHRFHGEEIITISDTSTDERSDSGKRNKAEGKKNENTDLLTMHPARSARFRFSSFLMFALVCITFAGIGFIVYQKYSAVEPRIIATTDGIFVKSNIIVSNISVDAAQESADTGIKVLPGDLITIEVSGKHSYGTHEIWTYEGNKRALVSAAHAFQQADPWSLVGWVGTEYDQTDYFQVSKASPLTANKSGSLYFAVNDWKNEYGNNRGGLIVTVTLVRASLIYAQESDEEAAWGNGLVNLNKGDTLSITAAGKISYWISGEFYDLNGSDHQLEGLLAPTLNARCLIGKIGSGNPFKIGMNYPPQQVDENGWLLFSVNEQIREPKPAAFTNNSGDISVDIELVRSPEEFKNPL